MRDPLIPPAGHAPSWRDRLVAHFRRRGWRGFARLYDLLKPIGGRRQLRAVSRYGTQFFLTPWDSVDTHVLCEGFYESEVLESVRPALAQPGAVLWVVGANFGLHAITAKYLHPAATVVAFEPSPAMGARVIENCELNGVKLDLHAYALADATGALPFFANASGNPGMSTLHPVEHLPYDHRFYVATLTAAQVIERGLAPAPTAMIVDAEGAEIEVLRGMGAHLQAPALQIVVFEAENHFLERRAPADLHAVVTGAGFALRKLERRERTAHNLSNFAATRP
ncbi:MAG: FkbM family methyltransferase [Verrucomicrobia bacterium]|nr:FkbM family methyltransferase [Verrucomicrobiota bacterium]